MKWDEPIPIDHSRSDINDLLQVVQEFIDSGEPLVLSADKKTLTRVKFSKHKTHFENGDFHQWETLPDGWECKEKGRVNNKYYEITNEHGKVIAIESK